MPSTSPLYGPRVGEALKLAADAFADRRRKGNGAPYLTHLLAVATLVMEHGGDEEEVVAAVLHDYLEDVVGAEESTLAERFGPRVARIVRTLSDTTDATRKGEWRPRKEAYLRALTSAPADVKLVGAADKLHNARTTLLDVGRKGLPAFDMFTASRPETLWYYREAVRSLSTDFQHPLVEELREVVRLLHEAAGEEEPA